MQLDRLLPAFTIMMNRLAWRYRAFLEAREPEHLFFSLAVPTAMHATARLIDSLEFTPRTGLIASSAGALSSPPLFSGQFNHIWSVWPYAGSSRLRWDDDQIPRWPSNARVIHL